MTKEIVTDQDILDLSNQNINRRRISQLLGIPRRRVDQVLGEKKLPTSPVNQAYENEFSEKTPQIIEEYKKGKSITSIIHTLKLPRNPRRVKQILRNNGIAVRYDNSVSDKQ